MTLEAFPDDWERALAIAALAAYTLLDRGDLDLRLGAQAVGPYIVTVQRPEGELYRIAVAERDAPELENLVTVVFRRSEQREVR